MVADVGRSFHDRVGHDGDVGAEGNGAMVRVEHHPRADAGIFAGEDTAGMDEMDSVGGRYAAGRTSSGTRPRPECKLFFNFRPDEFDNIPWILYEPASDFNCIEPRDRSGRR